MSVPNLIILCPFFKKGSIDRIRYCKSMNIIKTFFWLSFSLLAPLIIGCTTVRYYPVNFVESLQHPTKFPDVFSSNVQNIEDVADKNPLGENEEVKITDVGENKNSSMHLIQIRENGELRPHYHKRHDEVIYVKKGSGIATLDGTRYLVKPGSILQIPSKTVHKFLNTGGEPFIGVSIFSPPFDGRDEKTIKEKKKAGRGVKEEKRLAEKKPAEKVSQRDRTSTVKELTDEEIQTSAIKSEKVAEKKLSKPAQEEWNSGTDKPSLSPKKNLPSEGKKKSKGATTSKEPAINIEDMHEMLTRLLELKEEGSISAEEYEEKKDALVEGRDIGELPEVKSPSKKKLPIEEEPFLQQEEMQVPLDKDVPDENQDTTQNTSSLYEESDSTIHETTSEEKESASEDKLDTLEEMKQEGLITEEDYENEKKELIDATEEETVSMPPSNTISNERIKELKELYEQELITEDDYKQKLKELTDTQIQSLATDISPNDSDTDSMPSNDTIEDERIKELKELYDQGFITQDDYEYKLKELTSTLTQNPLPDIFSGKEAENEKLSELNELKEHGLITEDDYEFKKAQLLSN